MDGVIYARVSTSAQKDDGTSLHTQVEACLKLADSVGCDVAPDRILREQGSGADPFRPGMVALKNELVRSKASCLFVYAPDRLSRDPYDLMVFREYLDTLGVQWHFVHGPKGDTPEDRLIGYLSGYMGQRERAEIAERTRRGKVEVARRGRLPIGTGMGLYGYDYDPVSKKRLINEVEAEVVRWIFQRYIEGMTEHAIAVELNKRGIKTKRGSPWRAISVKRALSNSSYKGETWYGKGRHKLVQGGRIERTPVPQSDWIPVDGFTPPIVDEDLFEKVQERLAQPKQRTGLPVYKYLLTGYIKCDLCGANVVGAGAGKQKKTRMYRCSATFRTADKPATCRASHIEADPLEDAVWGYVSSLLSHPALIAKSLTAHLEADSANLDEEIALLERQINHAKRREESLVQQYADGLIEDDLLLQQVGPIKEGRVRKEEELREAERKRTVRRDTLLLRSRIEDYAQRLREGLSVETFEGKRAALDALGAHAVVSKEEVTLALTVPADLLADMSSAELSAGLSATLLTGMHDRGERREI